MPFTIIAGLIIGIILRGASIEKCVAYVFCGIFAAQVIAMCLNFRLQVVHEDEEGSSLHGDQQQAEARSGEPALSLQPRN